MALKIYDPHLYQNQPKLAKNYAPRSNKINLLPIFMFCFAF